MNEGVGARARSRYLLVSAGVLALGLTAPDAWGQTCAADRPCFRGAYQECHTVVFDFSIVMGWDFFNVRYRNTGGGESQEENRSGVYTIGNARPSSTYTIKVQGCTSHFLRPSDCSPWVEQSVTTLDDFGPDTCARGWVWRGASPGDHVCVTPAIRDQAADDSARAASRRQPGGGPYGPDTCLQGYVWREAFPGDHACVTPQVRAQALEDNRAASSRRLCR